MNTDERGFFDSLTERVLGAVFEVSSTLGRRVNATPPNFTGLHAADLATRGVLNLNSKKRQPNRLIFNRLRKTFGKVQVRRLTVTTS